jgi:hypothetical protein
MCLAAVALLLAGVLTKSWIVVGEHDEVHVGLLGLEWCDRDGKDCKSLGYGHEAFARDSLVLGLKGGGLQIAGTLAVAGTVATGGALAWLAFLVLGRRQPPSARAAKTGLALSGLALGGGVLTAIVAITSEPTPFTAFGWSPLAYIAGATLAVVGCLRLRAPSVDVDRR